MRLPTKATLKKYGLTEDEWIVLYNKNGGLCYICNVPFDGSDRGEKPRLACVDHDHVKGFKAMSSDEKKKHIRGMLCSQCNRLLAQKSNTTKKLYKAIEYLERFENSK